MPARTRKGRGRRFRWRMLGRTASLLDMSTLAVFAPFKTVLHAAKGNRWVLSASRTVLVTVARPPSGALLRERRVTGGKCFNYFSPSASFPVLLPGTGARAALSACVTAQRCLYAESAACRQKTFYLRRCRVTRKKSHEYECPSSSKKSHEENTHEIRPCTN